MWPKGFDPENLTPDASLNKLVIAAVPGADPAHVGQRGGDLLARDAVARLAEQGCCAPVPRHAVSDWLLAAMADDRSGSAAAIVVDEMGDRLASLIATLRYPASAAAATGLRRTYLEAWQTLDPVFLGGGLMKGVVGERVAARAGAVLAAGRDDAPAVRRAPHPEWLPLLGAARSASTPDGLVVVLDGGLTSIKRGVATIRRHRLAGLRLLAPVPVAPPAPAELAAAMPVDVAAAEVVCSVASYIRDGRPIEPETSIYGALDRGSLESALGGPVRLVHDGTAAWRGVGTAARSAVIVLGTWLGVGVGPHSEPVLPYAADFTLDQDT